MSLSDAELERILRERFHKIMRDPEKARQLELLDFTEETLNIILNDYDKVILAIEILDKILQPPSKRSIFGRIINNFDDWLFGD